MRNIMEYRVESTNKNSRKFLESLMPSFVKQLKLTNSRRAVLVKVTDDIPEGMEGATFNVEVADCYLILIRAPKRLSKTKLVNMATTLAHEMIHVKQLAKGHLIFKKNNARVWMGKHYPAKTKYLDQPWELQALAQQEIVIRRAIE